jgi:hypothetical protein
MAGIGINGGAVDVEAGAAADDDVHLLVSMLGLVMGDEEQLAGVALVSVDTEGGDA